MTANLNAHEIAQGVAARVFDLPVFLLQNGYREGAECPCGSVVGEPGDSLGVHLTDTKVGVWSVFTEKKELPTWCTKCSGSTSRARLNGRCGSKRTLIINGASRLPLGVRSVERFRKPMSLMPAK